MINQQHHLKVKRKLRRDHFVKILCKFAEGKSFRSLWAAWRKWEYEVEAIKRKERSLEVLAKRVATYAESESWRLVGKGWRTWVERVKLERREEDRRVTMTRVLARASKKDTWKAFLRWERAASRPRGGRSSSWGGGANLLQYIVRLKERMLARGFTTWKNWVGRRERGTRELRGYLKRGVDMKIGRGWNKWRNVVEDFRDKERREVRRVVVVRRIWGWWGKRVIARGWKTWSDKVVEVRKRKEEMERGLKVVGRVVKSRNNKVGREAFRKWREVTDWERGVEEVGVKVVLLIRGVRRGKLRFGLGKWRELISEFQVAYKVNSSLGGWGGLGGREEEESTRQVEGVHRKAEEVREDCLEVLGGEGHEGWVGRRIGGGGGCWS
ncbi:hypothetical protein TrCOL_g1742 [Triparma columacea]|uniref:Uncharacterized protein n=1 Tax=Triparma columacea TaxID=722753 RepID=A0A9W7GAT3_9STRA|nr:hypothetical protein TrCOL_g1742 [Triparma columacea]